MAFLVLLASDKPSCVEFQRLASLSAVVSPMLDERPGLQFGHRLP